ncbi:MAG: 8-amino-7-oxononanoate synthase [Lysobacteraceae bacterium]|nr:MAG: 8-amino-7-oxononanoate synthase [Xanthomonadaceae bacterium]
MSSGRPCLRARLAGLASTLREQARWRALRCWEPLGPVQARVEGRAQVLFCGNDYLGLATHPALRDAAVAAIGRCGVGAGSAHLVTGHGPEHAALEEEVAEWLGRPRALLFGSGYLANLGILQALLGPGDLCVQDKLNHACLLDGARLSGALLRRYPHADVEAAARQLATRREACAVLATDGVFSMDGDIAPLAELAALCRREGALLVVDDAHGAGVLGEQGRGTAAMLGLPAEAVDLQLVTLGKAFGAYGAVVAGDATLVEALLQRARSYLFTTALPPAVAAAARAALRLIRGEEGARRRERLAALTARFRRGAEQLGLPLRPSPTPIQPLVLGADARAVAASAALARRGFAVAAIRPPTVPEGQARLRITLSAEHRADQVDALLEALHEVVREVAA